MMDLASIMNEGGASVSQAAPAPGKPQAPAAAPAPAQSRQQTHQQHPQHPHPSTPIQSVPPPHSFRDHSQPLQVSPPRSLSHEYVAHQTPFASPPPYPPASAPYGAPSRPPPPPLQQQLSANNVRSPSAGSVHVPPSPYSRQASAGAAGAAYPFPSPGHPLPDSASPIQQTRYPPATAYPPRDSYPHAPVPVQSPGPPPSYSQGQHSVPPQTPPVGTPGGSHPYLAQHQRSMSIHSNPTPTSAQSQHQYLPQQYASPISTSHQQPSERIRQPSQPSTPLGPPLSSGQRQHSAGPPGFAQPQSPYQQRPHHSGPPFPPYQTQPQHQHHQQPPAPQQPPQVSPGASHRPQASPYPPVQRAPSMLENSQAADPQRRSLSHSERGRSLSVSPKTRVPSLPSSAGHHSQASISGPSAQTGDWDHREPQPQLAHHNALQGRADAPPAPVTRVERASTPAKRKMDDRDVQPDELERQEPRPPPFEANGVHRQQASIQPGRPSTSPMIARRKRRHAAPPVWAHVYNKEPLRHNNFVLRKSNVNHGQLNGKSDQLQQGRQDPSSSRHASPETARSNTQAPAPAPASNQTPPATVSSQKPSLLGPWEMTVSNSTPFDEMSRTVADFLFLLVVNNGELGSIHDPNNGVQYEIEAKLGHVTDRNSPNQRISFQVQSEAVLAHSNNTSFVSSMTEAQHKGYNEFLNFSVAEASPQNPKNRNLSEPRVPINYVHLRESDRFYKVPNHLRQQLHPALHQLLGNKSASVRVTSDQKTGKAKAAIIKGKVADLHIVFPQCDLDCRVSVNVEVDWTYPVDELEELNQVGGRDSKSDRHKDRLSYKQGNYRVDLTQVTQTEPGPNVCHLSRPYCLLTGPSKTDILKHTSHQVKIHELEIELDAGAVIDQGGRAMRGEPHNYDFLVEGFVNNIRLLARKAREMAPSA